MAIFDRLIKIAAQKGAAFFVLLDPDYEGKLVEVALNAEEAGADAILIGGSLVLSTDLDRKLLEIKQKVSLPVIIFPGAANQLSPHADAVLFTSLLSGRNPEYLIGQQVRGAPLVKDYGLEPIPTAYILIESGVSTSVQYLSHTLPVPADKPDIVKAHALAAEYLGMKLVYLEAGSGAVNPVPDNIIVATRDYTSLPLICGGGITRPEIARAKVLAGADFVVIGNRFEGKANLDLMREFADAIHYKTSATVL